MKLKFTIDYRTEWGQQLVVAITYRSQDGSERQAQLPMLTEDGEHWMAETSVLESRRSPVESFTYIYIVEDAEGKVLRRE
jgi:4-alpha-glucanotransferase